MNFKKHKKEIRNYTSIKSKVAYALGFIVKDMKRNPMIHYFEVKKHLFQNKVTITIYCERPGLLIGKQGETIEKLKMRILEDVVELITINFVEFDPIIYPYCDNYDGTIKEFILTYFDDNGLEHEVEIK